MTPKSLTYDAGQPASTKNQRPQIHNIPVSSLDGLSASLQDIDCCAPLQSVVIVLESSTQSILYRLKLYPGHFPRRRLRASLFSTSQIRPPTLCSV